MSEYNKNSRMSSIKNYAKKHKNEIVICAVSALSMSVGYYFASQIYKNESELRALIRSTVDDNTSIIITKAKDKVNVFSVFSMSNERVDFTHAEK